MKVEDFLDVLGCEYFAGVPDSQLKALCDCLYERHGLDPARHVVAANEGCAVALAAGYHLATGRVGCVYMQNSGQGNAVNPLASLTSPAVYAIPLMLVIGWRGEPGVRDEPQHVQQGAVTLGLLDVLGIRHFAVGRDTAAGELAAAADSFGADLSEGRCVAYVVRKGALEYGGRPGYGGGRGLAREEAVRIVAEAAGDDPVVSTTGKASRELFEIREAAGQGHGRDFLTVGSMGHASSIAMGIASQLPGRTVWCIDGDGAAIMHLGALAVLGASGVANVVHVVVNNGAHETVGGMPTAARRVDLPGIARACGYRVAMSADDGESLRACLERARELPGPTLVEARCALGSRPDLGRPTTTPVENKLAFMDVLGAVRILRI